MIKIKVSEQFRRIAKAVAKVFAIGLAFLMIIMVIRGPGQCRNKHSCDAYMYLDFVTAPGGAKAQYGSLQCYGSCRQKGKCQKKIEKLSPKGGYGLIEREWCACEEAGEEEPQSCRAVKEIHRMKRSGDIVKLNCSSHNCGEHQSCSETHVEVEAPGGVDKRFKVYCDCLRPSEK